MQHAKRVTLLLASALLASATVGAASRTYLEPPTLVDPNGSKPAATQFNAVEYAAPVISVERPTAAELTPVAAPVSVVMEQPGLARNTGPVPLMQPPPPINTMRAAHEAGLGMPVPFSGCDSSADYNSMRMQRWLLLAAGLLMGVFGGWVAHRDEWQSKVKDWLKPQKVKDPSAESQDTDV